MPDRSKGEGGTLSLLGVLVSAAGFAAALTCVYSAMRHLMITSGGACASGGPYTINPGQQCSSGDTALLVGGILLGIVFTGLLGWASETWCGPEFGGIWWFTWSVGFAVLGFNFIQLGLNPPPHVAGAGGWVGAGVVFWLMALGGLIPALFAFREYFKYVSDPEAGKQQAIDEMPIVRANVNFVRSTFGDPAYGMSDPTKMGSPAGPGATAQAPTTEAGSSREFIDPVTGKPIEQEGPQ